MGLIKILLFLFSSQGFALSISFWNLQNFYGASGLQNMEFSPINHPQKKSYCQKNKKGWMKRKCLYTHWTEQKSKSRSEVFKEEIGLLPKSDLWCFVEVESKHLVNSLFDSSEKRLVIGVEQNPRGQNIYCALSREIVPSFLSYRIFQVKDGQRKVLEIRLKYGKKIIYLLVLHLPSQFQNDRQRAYSLTKIISMYRKKKFIVLGDFNMRSEELKKFDYLKVNWRQSKVGGTYYYKKEKAYENFDQFLSNFGFFDASILVPKRRDYSRGLTIPLKYSFSKAHGLSDHFPIRMEIKHSHSQYLPKFQYNDFF
jgi:hypothetical protein